MTTKDITLLAILTAILVAAQLAFSMVMGLNLVFPLLIIYTYNLGFKKTMIIMLVFNIIEFFIWGFVLTFALYSWTFTVLIIGAYLMSRVTKNEYLVAVFALFYFMLFGFMASVQEWILTDVGFYVYWMRGIWSDFLGAIAGFGTVALLLHPISRVIKDFLESRTTSLSE